MTNQVNRQRKGSKAMIRKRKKWLPRHQERYRRKLLGSTLSLSVLLLIVPLLAACGQGPATSGPTSSNAVSASSGSSLSTSPSPGEPIPIGALLPLTGAGSLYGPNMQQALELGVEDINKAGGPLGRPIHLVTIDDETNPNPAVLAAQKMISVDHVVAVVGGWSSAVTLAVIPIFKENNIVELNGSGDPSITSPENRALVFRTQPISENYAAAMAAYARAKGYAKISLMTLNNPASIAVSELFKKIWKGMGMPDPTEVAYNANAPSYDTELSKALASGPDLLLIPGYQPDLTVIVKEWYATGIATHIMAPLYAINPGLIKDVGPQAAEGLLAVGQLADVNSPQYITLAARFKATTGNEIANEAVQAWDQLNIVALAMEAAGSTDGTAVAAKIPDIAGPPGQEVSDFATGLSLLRAGKDINYQGASGPVDFSVSHDVITNFGVWVVTNGAQNLETTFTATELSSIAGH
jgi:ABC-type branched-subunit amino acid transport system substrate-binding protein